MVTVKRSLKRGNELLEVGQAAVPFHLQKNVCVARACVFAINNDFTYSHMYVHTYIHIKNAELANYYCSCM